LEQAPEPAPAPSHDGRAVARDAAASVGARLVAMAASSVTAILIAASLAPGEYGAYAVAAGLAGVLSASLDLGLTSSLARYIAQGRGTPRLVGHIALARGALMLFIAAIVVGVSFLLDPADHPSQRFLPVAGAIIVAQGAIAFLYGALPSMRRIRLLLTVTVIQPILELIAVAIIAARGGGATDMLLAAAGAATAGAIIGYASLAIRHTGMRQPHRAGEQDAPAVTLRDVATYGRQLFLVTLLMFVFGQIDQVVIALFHSAREVAPYALAIKLQALLTAPAITASGVVAPRIAGAGRSALAAYRQWAGFYLVTYIGAAILAALLAGDVFHAINVAYSNDSGVLIALLPFIVLSSLATLPSITLNQVGHAGDRLRIAAISLTINAVLDFALIPPMAAYGAAISTSVAFAFYAGAHHRILVRVLREAHAPDADTVAADATATRALLRGGVFAVAVGTALSLILRPLIEHVVAGDGRAEAVAVTLGAGVVPGMVLVALAARAVRHRAA